MAAGTRTNINARRKSAAQNKIAAKPAKTVASKSTGVTKSTGVAPSGLKSKWSWSGGYTAPVSKPWAGVAAAPAPAAPAQAAPAPAPAATPVATPTVEPFWTPEQAGEWTDRHTAMASGLYDLDTALEHMGTNTTEQEQQIDTAKEKDLANSIDNMIARGLAHSSIKDGDLYDIGATAALKKAYLDAALNTATIETGRRKKIITDNWNDWISRTYNPEGVANAQSITPAVAPEDTQTPPVTAPAQSAPSPVKPTLISTTQQPSTVTPTAPNPGVPQVTAPPRMQATKGVGTGHIPGPQPRSPHRQAATAWHAARPRKPKAAR